MKKQKKKKTDKLRVINIVSLISIVPLMVLALDLSRILSNLFFSLSLPAVEFTISLAISIISFIPFFVDLGIIIISATKIIEKENKNNTCSKVIEKGKELSESDKEVVNEIIQNKNLTYLIKIINTEKFGKEELKLIKEASSNEKILDFLSTINDSTDFDLLSNYDINNNEFITSKNYETIQENETEEKKEIKKHKSKIKSLFK